MRLRNRVFLLGSHYLLSGQVLHIQNFKQVASSAAIYLWVLCTQIKKELVAAFKLVIPFPVLGGIHEMTSPPSVNEKPVVFQ